MRKKRILVASMTFCVVSVLLLLLSGICFAEEAHRYQVISCLHNKITPESAAVTKGTTVIFLNESPGNIEVHFNNTENMFTVCDSPVRFVPDPDGQFISDTIPFAGVATLCFIHEGEFNYVCRRKPKEPGKDTAVEFKGKIIVK